MSFVLPARGYCGHGLQGEDCVSCAEMGELQPTSVAPTSLNLIPLGLVVLALAWFILKGKR